MKVVSSEKRELSREKAAFLRNFLSNEITTGIMSWIN
jgi:hypothetical protein